MIRKSKTTIIEKIQTIIVYIKSLVINNLVFSGIPNLVPLSSVFIYEDNCKIRIGRKFCTRGNTLYECDENADLIIGDNVFVNRGCAFVAKERINIGSDCIFGPNVFIFDHDHEFNSNGVIKGQYVTKAIEIGNNVWIGAGSIILKGAVIGDNSIIGANTVVSGYIPERSIVTANRLLKVRGE